MTVGSLFSGVGGFDLGFQRAGFQIAWQVEIDPFCRRVLEKHWPHVRRYEDVRTVGAWNLEPVDVVCGGFPCQDISSAGLKVGITGSQSGLWGEFSRIIRELRPRYVVVENVAMLTSRVGGLGLVLGDLAEDGYDAEWESLPAALFGAPHLRRRTVVVGYAHGDRQSALAIDDEASWMPPLVANAEHALRAQLGTLGRAWGPRESLPWDAAGECTDSALAVRVADGVSDRLDRLGGLGNAVLPQVTEFIAHRIKDAEARLTA